MTKQVYWLSEAEWTRIEPLLPRGRKGAHRVDDRRVISGIMHMLKSGSRWRDCPDVYSPYTTVYNRFNRWSRQGISAAFLIAVRKSMRPIRATIGATTINPELLTRAERLQYEGYLRREETTAAILNLSKGGAAIKRIVRMTGHSRQLVRHVLRGLHGDVFRTR